MWEPVIEAIPGKSALRIQLVDEVGLMSVEKVLEAWRGSPEFREFFNELLANASLTAFRWEVPAMIDTSLSQPFEFVLLDSPGLARQPEPEAFAEHFVDNDQDIAVFPNLSGDATMIVPREIAEPSAYGHLAAFVRHAPTAQRHSLWQSIGTVMSRRIGRQPLWLSTAGAGVSWLHVRIDTRPKYYGHAPYREKPKRSK